VNGVLKKLLTTSYYVPEATILRLFSPQAYFKSNPKGRGPTLGKNVLDIFNYARDTSR
jgi:hypothetical protein